MEKLRRRTPKAPGVPFLGRVGQGACHSIGGGPGLLLIIAGTGPVLHRQPEDRPTR